MGKAIGLVPGKSEEYLLLEFEVNCRLWLRGNNDEPVAYIEAALFGNEMHYGYAAFTEEAFTRHYHNGSAEAALMEDLAFARRLGIHSLPSYLIQHKDKALLMQSFEFKDFAEALKSIIIGVF